MPRYIDADIAVAQITRLKDNDSSKYDLGLDTAINEIKYHMPTADVVEVVRCKDCKWFGKVGCAIMIADDYDKPTEDDYCSFAERREDEL